MSGSAKTPLLITSPAGTILSLRLLVGEMAEKGTLVQETIQGWSCGPRQAGSRVHSKKNRLVLSIVEEFALEISQLVLQLIDSVIAGRLEQCCLYLLPQRYSYSPPLWT